jgi:hypothetical protein
MTRKPRTQAQLDEATDRRLKKTYGVGLDWYDHQIGIQNGGCWICESKPGTRRLHVDHDHSWKKIKIIAFKEAAPYLGFWAASAVYGTTEYTGHGAKKSLAIRMVKDKLKQASVRGLLCYSCNAGLQKYKDSPDLFRRAADYLERHQNGFRLNRNVHTRRPSCAINPE